MSDWVTRVIDPIKTSRGYQRLCRRVFHWLRPRSDRALRVRGHVIHYSTFDRFLALTLWKILSGKAEKSKPSGNYHSGRPCLEVIIPNYRLLMEIPAAYNEALSAA